MGGDMQPQGQTQIILNRVDYGLDVQCAADSPRWHHEGSSQSMGEDRPGMGPRGMLRLEAGVPAATRKALADLGWPLGESDGGFGRYECIELRKQGADRVYAAAAKCVAMRLHWRTRPSLGCRRGRRELRLDGVVLILREGQHFCALGRDFNLSRRGRGGPGSS